MPQNPRMFQLPTGTWVNAQNFNAVVALTEEGFGQPGVLLSVRQQHMPPILSCDTAQDVYAKRDAIIGAIDRAYGQPVPRTEHGDFIDVARLSSVAVHRPTPPEPAAPKPAPPVAAAVPGAMSFGHQVEYTPTPYTPLFSLTAAFGGDEGAREATTVHVTCKTDAQVTWLEQRILADAEELTRRTIEMATGAVR